MRQPNPDTRHPNDPWRDPAFDEWWEKEQDRIEEERIDAALEMRTDASYIDVLEAVWDTLDALMTDDNKELAKRILKTLLTVPEVKEAVRRKL